jgi:acyl-coenzyme A synthetase/AMP-(fatty) acid ligase
MYPHDIRQELAKIPAPRALIGTPIHLRALMGSQHELPALANVLCATSPLDKALAENIENRYATTVREVFGCSEVGSMAVRRTAQTGLWTKFDDLMFVQDGAAHTEVSATHLPQVIKLEDRLEFVDSCHFRLLGRDSDQIKIAGKRGSLTQANDVLLKCSGVLDGVVLFPPQNRDIPRLVALVVLEEGVVISDVRSHCRQYLDSAFVPRPILAVDKLPREDNGKLVKVRLHAFYQSALANLKA